MPSRPGAGSDQLGLGGGTAGGSSLARGGNDRVVVDRVARWNGAVWEALPGGGADGGIFKVIAFRDWLVAAGSFDTIGGVAADGLAKWDGSQWSERTPASSEPRERTVETMKKAAARRQPSMKTAWSRLNSAKTGTSLENGMRSPVASGER